MWVWLVDDGHVVLGHTHASVVTNFCNNFSLFLYLACFFKITWKQTMNLCSVWRVCIAEAASSRGDPSTLILL